MAGGGTKRMQKNTPQVSPLCGVFYFAIEPLAQDAG